MEDRTISAILKDLRHHAGLTQAALSKELHISRQVYSCYETGRQLLPYYAGRTSPWLQ